MSHILFFTTVVIIVLSIIPLVILLSSINYLNDIRIFAGRICFFLAFFIAAAICNMVLYYDYEIANIHIDKIFYQFGWYYLYFLAFFMWLPILKYICNNKFATIINKLNSYLLVIFTTAWIFAATLAQEHFWDIISLWDKVYMLFIIAGIICCIAAIVQKKIVNKASALYCISFFLLNLATFYWREDSSLIYENIYMLSWVGISLATMIYIIYIVRIERMKKKTHLSENSIDVDDVYQKLSETYSLTKREEEILRELYMGKSNQQIANDLCISEATVKAHIHNLLGKMNVGSRVEAIVAIQKRMFL